MSKSIFQDLLHQNQVSCGYTFKKVSSENLSMRLTPEAATVGFMYRHIGEIMHLMSQFFGIPTEVKNSTMGFQDEGQGNNMGENQQLVEEGYAVLQKIIDVTADDKWAELVETPFFGTISKTRLFSHILYHNAYHAGQIALTLKRG